MHTRTDSGEGTVDDVLLEVTALASEAALLEEFDDAVVLRKTRREGTPYYVVTAGSHRTHTFVDAGARDPVEALESLVLKLRARKDAAAKESA